MAEGTPTKSRTVLWFVVGFAVLFATSALRVRGALGELVWNLSDNGDTRLALGRLYALVAQFVSVAYTMTLGVSAIVTVLGAGTRLLARARVRAGFRDPIERVRKRVAARPRLTAALLAAPPLVFVVALLYLFTAGRPDPSWDTILAGAAIPALATVLAQTAITRRGLRALLAPTLSEEEASGDVRAEGFTFTAVAVTTETIGAVGALAALSAIMLALVMALPTSTLVRNPAFAVALVAYLALAVGGPLLFRRASRIRVGLDGIHVSGSARSRFVPYREIDLARVSGHTIELCRGTRIVLRLQLHGEDAIRRAALTARINAAIALAVKERDEPAIAFVASASSDAIGRAAGGASSYREAPPSREKLWQVLESPAVDAAGRKAAAAALARDGDAAERTRLRVAAEQCAEPTVRARIEELLEVDEEIAPARALEARRL